MVKNVPFVFAVVSWVAAISRSFGQVSSDLSWPVKRQFAAFSKREYNMFVFSPVQAIQSNLMEDTPESLAISEVLVSAERLLL